MTLACNPSAKVVIPCTVHEPAICVIQGTGFEPDLRVMAIVGLEEQTYSRLVDVGLLDLPSHDSLSRRKIDFANTW
jgi:hypothetical protein